MDYKVQITQGISRYAAGVFLANDQYLNGSSNTVNIARRHGHVFRVALHNEGDWRMETWQRARQGELSCLHTPIPELCNAILNTCQMPSRFYIIPSNVNKSQTHLLKPFTARDLMEGHISSQNTLMFVLVFCFELRARACGTCCHCHLAVKKPIHDGNRGQLHCQKVMSGTIMWSCDTELCTNGVEASKYWVFIAHFSIYSTSRCRCHAGTNILRLRGHTRQISQVVRTVRHRISCCAPTIHWKLANQVPTSPVKTLVIRMSWSNRCFEWQER